MEYMMNPKYRKMIERLAAKKSSKRKKVDPWYLYILKCSDGRLYTGITNNVSKRFLAHQSGKGARFTRVRLPVELMYQESCSSRSAALIREFQVKALPRKKKELLVFSPSISASKIA